jgi:hypothetical protein
MSAGLDGPKTESGQVISCVCIAKVCGMTEWLGIWECTHMHKYDPPPERSTDISEVTSAKKRQRM